MKGGFGRVHGDSASFAINLTVREGEHGPRDYPAGTAVCAPLIAKASGYGVTGVGGTPLGEKVAGARSER